VFTNEISECSQSHGLMEKGKEGVSESAKQCFETHKKDVVSSVNIE